MKTILAKLLAKQNDSFGYVTYIFRNTETEDIFDKYMMCTQYPNWQHRMLELGEVGYLTYEEHLAGYDKWFDGNNMRYYNYTHIQFIKFIDKPKEEDNFKELIL